MAASERVVVVAGGKVPVQSGGSGPPLLVLHRDTGPCGWLPLYERLAKKYLVVVPTLPGYAGTDVPKWARHPRDIGGLLQWLIQELKLGKPAVLGLGFGGWVASEMISLAPGCFRSMVLASPMGIKPEKDEIYDQFLAFGDDYVRMQFADEQKFTAKYGDPVPIEQRETWEINREMTTRIAWKPYMFNYALPELLQGCATRTLLVWGKEDRIVPLEVGELYKKALRNARLEQIAQSGHAIEIEQPDRLADLIEGFVT
jgi:pimeloyl-ACP methyl ester carboxylesterase